MALFATYLIVASLIAFFTVKIIGIPIGKKMFTKIVLSIVSFIPVYLVIAFLLSKFVSRDLKRLEESVRGLPFSGRTPRSWIKEIDKLGEVISLQAERIRELIDAQRFMLYRITHDLKTPITNIKNVISAIKDGVISEDEQKEYLGKLLRETDRMNALLDEALSNLKKVSRKTETRELDLCSFLKELVDIWQIRCKEKGLRLKLDCEDGISLKIPPTDLEEIINNLIDNALKHTNRGWVSISAYKESSKVLIKVRDTGNGFNSARLQDAYRKGSLGLYIVRELTWKNGGQVEINTLDGGTEVVLSFRGA